jgi:hypothetical protein
MNKIVLDQTICYFNAEEEHFKKMDEFFNDPFMY